MWTDIYHAGTSCGESQRRVCTSLDGSTHCILAGKFEPHAARPFLQLQRESWTFYTLCRCSVASPLRSRAQGSTGHRPTSSSHALVSVPDSAGFLGKLVQTSEPSWWACTRPRQHPATACMYFDLGLSQSFTTSLGLGFRVFEDRMLACSALLRTAAACAECRWLL